LPISAIPASPSWPCRKNPPRNVNWASSGRVAKVAFEKYFLHKVRAGTTEPYYEKKVMRLLDIGKTKRPAA
jgi:sulfide:quinone oxidoreductase